VGKNKADMPVTKLKKKQSSFPGTPKKMTLTQKPYSFNQVISPVSAGLNM
jgi:hypothetical protein